MARRPGRQRYAVDGVTPSRAPVRRVLQNKPGQEGGIGGRYTHARTDAGTKETKLPGQSGTESRDHVEVVVVSTLS